MSIGYNPKVITDGLVLYLDPANTKSYSGSGTAWKDVTDPNVSGTMYNVVPTQSGYFTFSTASSSRVEFPVVSKFNILNDITLDVWFNATTTTGAGLITYGTLSGEQYAIWATENKIMFSTSWPTPWQLAYSSVVSNNTWYHAVATFSNGVWKIYKNGILDTTGTFTTIAFPAVSNAYLVIGNNHPGGQEYFDGKIGPIKIYNKVLTASEIQLNFAALRGRYGI